MKLTEGILKSIDSGIEVEGRRTPYIYIIKYNGTFCMIGNKIHYANEGAAKSAITKFVYRIFWHGAYWQSCAKNIKARNGYEVDFSATLDILHSHGLTSRFQEPKNKKMFKDLASELLKQGILKIEEIKL